MDRTNLILLCLLLVAGALLWLRSDEQPVTVAPTPLAVVNDPESLRALEAELLRLRDQQQRLLERVAELEAAGSPLAPLEPAPLEAAEDLPEEVIEEPTVTASDAAANRRLLEAGLTPQEFTVMQQRAQELYRENFENEWLARREAFLASEGQGDSRQQLRREMGDDAYDRYLYASGRPNRVRVRRVMEGSAAVQAGISEGDMLLSYDGQRLFRFEDLREASYRGEPGELVTVEIARTDGTVSQLVIPRGPMGISGYGNWRQAPDGSFNPR